MSKVRDIIDKGATELEEDDGGVGAWYIDISEPFNPGLVAFYQTFDPEHVALMEAVVEAVHDWWYGGKKASELYDRARELNAYRRKHGLV